MKDLLKEIYIAIRHTTLGRLLFACILIIILSAIYNVLESDIVLYILYVPLAYIGGLVVYGAIKSIINIFKD